MIPFTDRPYRQAALAAMSNPPREKDERPGHKAWSCPVSSRRMKVGR